MAARLVEFYEIGRDTVSDRHFLCYSTVAEAVCVHGKKKKTRPFR